MSWTHPDLDRINAAIAQCQDRTRIPAGHFEIMKFPDPKEDGHGGLIIGSDWGWDWGWMFEPDVKDPDNFIGFDTGHETPEDALENLKEYVGFPEVSVP